MSSASRMASFINQKSTCSHLDPYALILRHGAEIGTELSHSISAGNPQKYWQNR